MQELLAACHAKIRGSEQHLDRLGEAVDGFFEGKNQVAALVGEANTQRTKYVFRVESVIEWPAIEWGVIIGDAVHCLRSALDQLVYGLASQPSAQTAFPICRTEREWATQAPARYWSVGPTVVFLINNAQPYKRGDEATEHPLALLSALSNLDKHRSIPTVALAPDHNTAEILRTRGIANTPTIRFKKGSIYESGAVVAECKIVPDDSGFEPEMDVNVASIFEVAFGDIPGAQSLRGKPVVDALNEIGSYAVAALLNPLTKVWNEVVDEVDAKMKKLKESEPDSLP